jgi:sterol desaturase/sphingolipid hydroxylase (fatty acid hydroxylase superfamily)
MDTSAFFNTLIILGGFMALLSVIETIVPLQMRKDANRTHLAANLGLTLITFATTLLLNLASAAGAAWIYYSDLGLFQYIEISGVAALFLGVIALDFSTYVAHVVMHKTPALWRVHLVHHIDPAVDVTTSFRQHPIETLLRFAFIAIPATALGVPPAVVAFYRTLSATNALLEHANVQPPQRADMLFSLFWVTPNMHKVHHSRRQEETDSNYGNLLSLYDRFFRTFTPTGRALSVRYGIDGCDQEETQTLGAAIMLPFRAESRRQQTSPN